ncbi:MAG: 50S ribosomal protein L21 [Candidatus Cloacimonetes bacterium]|nr:50S ribosomal protein L21 [Candidatus Cloacimonadota bacterium]
MYAVVEFKGVQFKVEKDKVVKVPFLADEEIGTQLELDHVLMISSDEKTLIGNPLVKNALVKAEIVSHGKDKKIIIFKKKRRKGYAKKQGHRQDFTEIMIKDIVN